MSSENSIINDLVKRQNEQKKDLAAGAYETWRPIKEREVWLLEPYGGKYEKAPSTVQEQINKAREAFFLEWGSDGKLAALMEDRHQRERIAAAKRQHFIEKLQNGSNKDRGIEQE